MRIKEFFISGFGIFAKEHVRDLSPGLNLFVGDNEAGKSTLLAFFRAIFFGFESGQSKENPYKPVGADEHGGVITVGTERDGKEYAIKRGPGRAQGEVWVTMPDGNLRGEDVTGQLLPGMTKDLYRNVFAFSLDELQGLDSLKGQDVRSRIYSYGVGAGMVSAVDVERQLEHEMGDIFRPQASTKRANTLLGKLDDVHIRMGELRSENSSYHDTRERLAQVSRDLDTLEQSIAGMQGEIIRLGQLERAWEPWTQLCEAKAGLERVPAIQTFPEDGIGRLDRCEERIKDIEAEQKEKAREQEREQAKLCEVDVDERLVEARSTIDSLMQGREHLESALKDLSGLRKEAEAAHCVLGEALRQIGEEWDEEKLESFDTSMPVIAEVQDWRARLERCSHDATQASAKVEEADRSIEESKEKLENAERQMTEMDLAVDSEHIAQQEGALKRVRSGLSKVDTLNLEIEHLRQQYNERGQNLERCKRDADQQSRPFYRKAGMVLALALTTFVVLSRSNLPTAVGLGVLALLTLVAGEMFERNSRAAENERRAQLREDIQGIEEAKARCEKGMKERGDELQKAETEISSAWADLGRQPGTLDDIDRLEADLNKAKEILSRCRTLKEQVEDSLRHCKDAKERQGELQAKLEETKTGWLGWLSARCLRPTLTPETTLELLHKIEAACDKLRTAREKDERAAQVEKYLDEREQKLNEVLESCGRSTVDRGGMSETLSRLKDDLQNTLNNASERNKHQENLDRLSLEISSWGDKAQRAQDEFVELLRLGSAADAEDFRKRGRYYSDRQERLLQVQQRENEIAVISGLGKGAWLQGELAQTDELSVQTELANKKEGLEHSNVENKEKLTEKGSLLTTIKEMERSDELSTATAEESSLRANLEREASDWAVRAICKEVLRQTRERYEKEKQPRVIREASGFLTKITSGAYEVMSPYGQEEAEVVTPGGVRRTRLSRGTREQLYLSLRFGLIRQYSSDAESLPVLMDDILVNFDPKRSRAAAETVLELSRSNQVVFFTCHPETADLFSTLDRTIAQFVVQNGKIARVAP